MEDSLNQRGIKDPFGFNKAINWDKLKDPKVLEELKKLFDEKEKNLFFFREGGPKGNKHIKINYL